MSARLGQAYWALNNHEEALNNYEDAYRKDPTILRRIKTSIPVVFPCGMTFLRSLKDI